MTKLKPEIDQILKEIAIRFSPSSEFYLRSELNRQSNLIDDLEKQFESLNEDYREACIAIGQLEVNVRHARKDAENKQYTITQLESELRNFPKPIQMYETHEMGS